ncbi:MAG TPA: S46 family peptidase [Polyangiaceae bacterium]|nr:S46 family peptidase [Polyangiaceae bacterium]
MFTWARQIVRGTEEVTKPNEQRLEEYADARLPGFTQRLLAPRPLNRPFEIAKLTFGLDQLREELGSDHPFVKQVLGKQSPEELAAELVKGSKLDEVAERKRLWEGGKAAVLASKDRMIQLALAIDDTGRKLRARYQNELQSVVTKNSELVAKARFDVYGMNSYPDATFSARVSFGTVRGWREPGKVIPSFTRIGGAFDRATGRFPYALPKSWLDKQKQLDLNTPFNFVTDNDIIGGNSGSPVVNRQGELVGLVFDGNIHSLGGAYGFDISQNRMVAVDVRAIVHALDVVYGASRISDELAGKTKE